MANTGAQHDQGRRPLAVVAGTFDGRVRAACTGLASQGFDVAVVGADEAALRAASDLVMAHGASTLAVRVEPLERDQLRSAAAEIEERLGTVDAWVCDWWPTPGGPTGSAPVTAPGTGAMDPGDAATATSHTVVAAADHLRRHDHGVLVVVLTALAACPLSGHAARSAAEAEVRAQLATTRSELARAGSRVRVGEVIAPLPGTADGSADDLVARAVLAAVRGGGRRRYVGWRTRALATLGCAAPGVLEQLDAMTPAGSPQQLLAPKAIGRAVVARARSAVGAG